jgi:hypothetical protein
VNTLVSASDLADFPGSPLEPIWVDIAAADVRREAGWHIAPVLTETLTVEAFGGRHLVLPSRRVVSVASVVSPYYSSTDWTLEDGYLFRAVGWSGTYQVTLTHGYDSCPVDLLPVLAGRATNAARRRDPSVASTTVGQIQTSYFQNVTSGSDPVVTRYSVKVGVA